MATVTNLNANPRAATDTSGTGTGPNGSGAVARTTSDGYRFSTAFGETSTPATSATATGMYTVGNGTATSGYISVSAGDVIGIRQAAKVGGTGTPSLFLRIEAWTSAAGFIELADIDIRDRCTSGTWYELFGLWKVPSNAARIQIRVVQVGSTGVTSVRCADSFVYRNPTTDIGIPGYGDTTGTYAPPSTPDPATLYVCCNDNTMNTATATIGPEQWANMLCELGVTAVRFGCGNGLYYWPSAGSSFDFGGIGRWINAALKVGVKPILIGPQAPPWITPTWPTDPTTWADMGKLYAAYAQTFPEAAAFDVFNEPNLLVGAGNFATAADYVTYMQTVYPLIKAAAPSMPVLAGCSACVGVNAGTNEITADSWWSQVYAGIKSYSDGLALHPYMQRSVAPTRPMTASTSTAGTRSLGLTDHVRSVRSYRDANGDSAKPLWLTEGGCSSGPTFLSEADQATYNRFYNELMRDRTRNPDVRCITNTKLSQWSVTSDYGQGLEQAESGTLRRKPSFTQVQQACGGAKLGQVPVGAAVNRVRP